MSRAAMRDRQRSRQRRRPAAGPARLLLAAALLDAPRAEAGGPCECLKWTEVYGSRGVQCGEGLELFMLGEKREGYQFHELAWIRGNVADLMKEFCTDFFQRMDNNLCVQVKHAPPSDELRSSSWCYVSSQCKELNFGHKVSDKDYKWLGFWPTTAKRDVSVKICQKGTDRRLFDMDPLEVKDLSTKGKFMLGHLILQSYNKAFVPHEGKNDLNGIILDDFMEAWKAGDESKLPEQVRSAMHSQTPLVINMLRDSHGDQALIYGKKMMHARIKATKDDAVPGGWRLECPDTMHCLDEDPCSFGCERAKEKAAEL